MSEYTLAEFAAKAEWEGGLADFLFGYLCGESPVITNSPEATWLAAKVCAVKGWLDELSELLPDPADFDEDDA